MEKLQLLAMVQAYTGIGIGLMVGLGALHLVHRDVAETLSKCNSQAMEVVTNRLSEGLEELRGMMKTGQKSAA